MKLVEKAEKYNKKKQNVNKEPCIHLFCRRVRVICVHRANFVEISHPGVLQLYGLDAGAHKMYRVLGMSCLDCEANAVGFGTKNAKTLLTFDDF